MPKKEVAPHKELDSSRLIVFVGQSGAGKTTIAEAIGFKGVASCDILRAEVARRGLEDTHINIHTVGMDLISEDPAWQAKRVLEMINSHQPFIFDGPRNPYDLEFLINSSQNVEIVGIYSPRAVRYQRVLEREQSPLTKMAFMQRCVDEVLEAGLNECLRLATVYVFNNGNSLDQIRQDAVSLMETVQSGSFPHVEPVFEGGMLGFEEALNTIPVPFANSDQMRKLMREYLDWEEEQLRAYQRGKISLERFL
jgi:dephospho-CoA kinase